MSSIRSQRVAAEIKKVLSGELLKTPAFLTILEVDASTDLKSAKIYFSLFGSEKACTQTLNLLELEKKSLRQKIAQELSLRITPELHWIRDNTPERADRINRLLKQDS